MGVTIAAIQHGIAVRPLRTSGSAEGFLESQVNSVEYGNREVSLERDLGTALPGVGPSLLEAD